MLINFGIAYKAFYSDSVTLYTIFLMKRKFIWTSLLLCAAFFGPVGARADNVPCLIVVCNDGSQVATPISENPLVEFGAETFKVSDKFGNDATYTYASVQRILLNQLGISITDSSLNEKPLAVWPTITAGTLYATGTEAKKGIVIYSVSGQKMLEVKPTDEITNIEVAGFAAGEYILRAGNTTVKFIKK